MRNVALYLVALFKIISCSNVKLENMYSSLFLISQKTCIAIHATGFKIIKCIFRVAIL